jgi:hypothetical protein
MRFRLNPRLLYALGSTVAAGVFFGLFGTINKFPFQGIGFGVFLFGVFCVAFVLFGRID